MKTVKELTVSLQLSKVTIYKALKSADLAEHVIKQDNMTYVDEVGEQLLIDMFSKPNSKVNSKLTEKINSDKNDITIQALINQLEIKDKQIADLTAALATAQQAYQTEQALHAGTIQTNLIAEKSKDNEPSPAPAPEKVSLWSRIFKRKD